MELAEVYLPDLHPRSAHRKLQHWITIYPGLPGRLLSLGYHEGERVYSPAMVPGHHRVARRAVRAGWYPGGIGALSQWKARRIPLT